MKEPLQNVGYSRKASLVKTLKLINPGRKTKIKD